MGYTRVSEDFQAIVSSWQETKVLVEHSLAFSRDSIHVLAGVVILLIAAALMKKPVSKPGPWLVVFALAVFNEFIDLWVERWPSPGLQYGEGLRDLILTMVTPTLLMLTARSFPSLYSRSRARPDSQS